TVQVSSLLRGGRLERPSVKPIRRQSENDSLNKKEIANPLPQTSPAIQLPTKLESGLNCYRPIQLNNWTCPCFLCRGTVADYRADTLGLC
ncbi:MAG: hypothetical protein SGJ20_11355, partial [Planctomycetota bacterium]|nr:hypothetical protein [Planctomycetota bacterium]